MDIRYQVKQIVYALDTLPVIPGHYKKTANQSACTIVAIEQSAIIIISDMI